MSPVLHVIRECTVFFLLLFFVLFWDVSGKSQTDGFQSLSLLSLTDPLSLDRRNKIKRTRFDTSHESPLIETSTFVEVRGKN